MCTVLLPLGFPTINAHCKLFIIDIKMYFVRLTLKFMLHSWHQYALEFYNQTLLQGCSIIYLNLLIRWMEFWDRYSTYIWSSKLLPLQNSTVLMNYYHFPEYSSSWNVSINLTLICENTLIPRLQFFLLIWQVTICFCCCLRWRLSSETI